MLKCSIYPVHVFWMIWRVTLDLIISREMMQCTPIAERLVGGGCNGGTAPRGSELKYAMGVTSWGDGGDASPPQFFGGGGRGRLPHFVPSDVEGPSPHIMKSNTVEH